MLKIKTDSRKVKPGDTFVALVGFNQDGHDYIESAIKNGASKIVCEKGEYSVPTLLVPDTKEWLQEYLVSNYKSELKKLKFIGVTGTNGKTTTCFLTYQQLIALGVNAAYIGTIGYYSKNEHYELANTTPLILDMYTMFLDAIDKGIDTIVMEVSSHALDMKRIEGVEFQTVAFTNLTEDHLDYHKTMENYLNAKLKILDYLSPEGKIVINGDDPYADYFKKNVKYTTLGFKKSDVTIENYVESLNGTVITFSKNGKKHEVKTNLRTKFNVYNYLTSVLLLANLGFDLNDILNISSEVTAPRGRCEQVSYNGGEIIVDYAHTPDAVEKILDAFKNSNRVITIIGCGGDRDPYKRPIMGEIATEKSNHVIFTNDNPRTENPENILKDILNGVKKDNYEVEPDRIKAIHKGIDMLEKGNTLLILGKGHEDYQIIGTTKHHLDDLEEVKKYIEGRR